MRLPRGTATALRLPDGLTGRDLAAVRRLLLVELRRPGVDRVLLHLPAERSPALEALIAEARATARAARVQLLVDPTAERAARPGRR